MLRNLHSWLSKKDFSERFKIKIIGSVNYPHEEMIKDLHDFLIKKFKIDGETNVVEGELRGISLHDIQSYLANQLDESDRLDYLIKLGASIFSRFLSRGHPYNDGNKRTGFAILWLFFVINDCEIDIDALKYSLHSKQISDWADYESDSSNFVQEIELWIKSELKPILKKKKR